MIGISSYMISDDFKEAVSVAASYGISGIELSCATLRDLKELQKCFHSILPDLLNFQYVSIHAPFHADMGEEKETVKILRSLLNQFSCYVVAHPDRIFHASEWNKLGDRLLIENMDVRKSTGRTVSQLKKLFASLPLARLCFDIGHARHLDPEMDLANKIADTFRNRIAEIHISRVDEYGDHHSLDEAAMVDFAPILKKLSHIPVIIETPTERHGVGSIDEVYREIDKVRKNECSLK